MKFRRLHVVVQDSLDTVSRDTVSRLTIERKYRNGRIVSLLEDETGRSLGESDDEVRIFRDTSTVPSLFVRTDQNTAQPADSISVRAILPKEAVFEVVREDPKVKYAETPWIPTKSGPLGCAEPFQIPRDFRIIERGGRMRVKYKISDTSPEEHQDVIAMDRHRLGIEMGTIFNANSDGTPIGKLEYSIFSESIWTRWLVANVGIRSTHMRVPSQFDSTLNKDVVKIAPVVEGEMTARASPCWKSDFDPRSVSFVAGIFGKTGPLDDSTDIRFYAGGGLGVAFAVPAYNERRSAKDFGRAAGFISLMGAYDSFWKEPARFRVRTDFRLDIFDIGTDAVTISLKGRLDFPVAHSAPIDVRLGISGSIDVSTLPGLIK